VRPRFLSRISFLTSLSPCTVPAEKPIVVRERLSGAYNVSAYYLGKNLSELPLDIVFNLLYCVIVYWMVGLNVRTLLCSLIYASVCLCLVSLMSGCFDSRTLSGS
jgi:hypothetical protein